MDAAGETEAMLRNGHVSASELVLLQESQCVLQELTLVLTRWQVTLAIADARLLEAHHNLAAANAALKLACQGVQTGPNRFDRP
jgi:hypothetical protein